MSEKSEMIISIENENKILTLSATEKVYLSNENDLCSFCDDVKSAIEK